MLSNVDIIEFCKSGEIIIQGFEEECLRPSSYLLRIGNTILESKCCNSEIDTRSSDTASLFEKKIFNEDGIVLNPNILYLLSSHEKIGLSKQIYGELCQLSSLSRLGLCVNFSSTLVSATYGFKKPSSLTFEVINLSTNPIRIYPYVKFVHIKFGVHLSKCDMDYPGIYSGHSGPTPANFELKPSR